MMDLWCQNYASPPKSITLDIDYTAETVQAFCPPAVPEHLPRERLVVPGPAACRCRCGTRMSKLGDDVTETLEVIPQRRPFVMEIGAGSETGCWV